ncbi:DUF4012 domain-containing protein [Amnibacterium sp.]|uniref:DUF4012 domain-containing protein n=1 Tax=Amnibacterium sp. TaxID=1872496 RepID=UPI003F7B8DFF
MRTRAQRIRRRITLGGVVALLLGVVAAVVLSVYVGNRALIAKDQLTAAQTKLTTFKSALGQPNAPSTAALYQQLQANTSKAADQVNDPVWSLYEHIPVLGPNLKAFRQTSDLIDALVRNGVGPLATAADGISVDSLKPKNGAIDIAPLKKLTPAMADIDDAITTADRSAAAIDTKDVAPQLQQPIAKLRSLLDQAAPVTHELRKVMPVLYPALGGNGTRHYLLIFQNNAEERASGGNPASMAMLVVDHGKIKLGRQGNSGDFPTYTVPPFTPSGPGNGDYSKIYTSYLSKHVTNITMTPDFPTTAKYARDMWLNAYGGKVDGVISFDPVALSYLMNATGPVTLADGTKLDSSNAVDFLLSGVYAKYTNPKIQDAVFASAAKSIFDAVTHGQGTPKAYVAQLTPMLQDQRLKMWSVRSDEEKLIMTSPMGTMLPADNTKATTVGVYNNDDSTSKMSYYMDETVDVSTNTCKPTPKYTVTAKVTNTLTLAKAYTLTPYVLAAMSKIPFGGDRQWVQLYGPVGAKLSAVYIDGQKVTWGNNLLPEYNTIYSATGEYIKRPAVQGHMYGRPVGVVSITIPAASTVTVKGVFTGGTDTSKTVAVSHTPKVRPVPVTLTQAKCG